MPLIRLLCAWTWRDRGWRFHRFAQAELSSRYDLLDAANRCSDPERVAALLRHAADEARHATLFRNRARELGCNIPLQADYEKLYQRLGEPAFFAFVARGEARAIRQFAVWRAWLEEGRDRAALDAVLPDEQRHAAYTRAWAGPGARAALWEFGRSWMRTGAGLSMALYTALCTLLYLSLAPLALWMRPVRTGR